MDTSILSLLGFAGWAAFLVAWIGVARSTEVLSGVKRANEFPSGSQHGGDLYWRINRAHINTLESLPIFAVVVLAAAATGVSGDSIDNSALVALLARVGQSLVHISGNSSVHVHIRFALFITQYVCFVGIGWQVARSLL